MTQSDANCNCISHYCVYSSVAIEVYHLYLFGGLKVLPDQIHALNSFLIVFAGSEGLPIQTPNLNYFVTMFILCYYGDLPCFSSLLA